MIPRTVTMVAIVVFILIAGISLISQPAQATPRYSAQYGQSCTLCHTNPTGGGMRSLYASQYLVPTELSMTRFSPEQLEGIRPDLSPAVSMGLDLRTLIYQGQDERGATFAMQGDVYTSVQMNEKFVAYLDIGRGGAQEYFGIAYLLPLHGYFKAGRFMPDYGWRFADHQMFSRRYLLSEDGNDYPSLLHDSGLEIGGHWKWFKASASLLQGGSGQNGDSYAGRIVGRLNPGSLNLALGTSILRREEVAGHKRTAGVFGYIAVGPVFYVGEVDETRNPLRTGLLFSNQLGWTIWQGFTLLGTYSFQDPDRDLKNGTRSRYGIGIDALTTPFFGVQLMANRYDFTQGTLISEDSFNQGELVLHFLY